MPVPARPVSWCALVGLVLAASPARGEEPRAFPAATPESQGIAAADLKALTDTVAGYVKAGTIVGGELLVIKNRKTVLHEAFGDRDREDKRPMERDTIFNIRSMTKPLTGMAVQILVDEGKVKLDDPVAKYLPGFDSDKSKAITVGQLLEHRSGLPLTGLVTTRDFKDLQSQAKAIGEKGPQFRPGEKFWYSDAGSDAAAAVVEKVTGTTIDKFVSERVLKPAGMADSFYVSAPADDPRAKRVASLYGGAPGKWMRFWKPGGQPLYPFAWGSQTLYSTPADYARFLTIWLDGGKAGGKQVLSADAVKRTLTVKSPLTTLGGGQPFPTGFDKLRPFYGQMSMLFAESPTAKVEAIGHGGSDGTGAWAFPADDLIVCYFTQSRGNLTTIRFEAVIEDALLRRGRPRAEVPAELKPLLGTYYANFGAYKNTPFRVVIQHGRLAVDIPDQLVFDLKGPDKDGRRQLTIAEGIAVSFKKGGDGKVAAMVIHEGGGTVELPTQPVKVEALTKETVAKYLGKYQREEDKVVVEVRFKDGGLLVHVPTTKVNVELTPGAGKTWQAQSGLRITFQEDAAGKVVSFTAELPDGKKLLRRRVE